MSIGHSAGFTWDGEILIFGHEPGGGGEARCQATSSEVDRTLFFFEASSGEPAGTFLHPRPQTSFENCTWHNYNVVPTDKRYVLVSGNYQSGVSVVDFTDPANASEIAYADPAPLSDTSLITGGRLVDVLIRRAHLRVGHQTGPDRLEPLRQRSGGCEEAPPPQSANAGDVVPARGQLVP